MLPQPCRLGNTTLELREATYVHSSSSSGVANPARFLVRTVNYLRRCSLRPPSGSWVPIQANKTCSIVRQKKGTETAPVHPAYNRTGRVHPPEFRLWAPVGLGLSDSRQLWGVLVYHGAEAPKILPLQVFAITWQVSKNLHAGPSLGAIAGKWSKVKKSKAK